MWSTEGLYFIFKAKYVLDPSLDCPGDQKISSVYLHIKFLYPLDGLEGYLCLWINVLGNTYLQYWYTTLAPHIASMNDFQCEPYVPSEYSKVSSRIRCGRPEFCKKKSSNKPLPDSCLPSNVPYSFRPINLNFSYKLRGSIFSLANWIWTDFNCLVL